MALKTPCDFAKARFVETGRLRQAWAWLLFVLGVTLALFLIAAVLLFIRSSFLPGALTTLGALVTGPAMKWITDQKKQAVEEDTKAFADLERVCGSTQVRIPGSGAEQGSSGPVMGFTPLAGIEGLTFDEGGEVETAEWFREIEAARQSASAAKAYLKKLRGY